MKWLMTTGAMLTLALAPDAVRAAAPPALAVVAPLTNGMEVRNGAFAIRVTALTDAVLRVRVAPRGAFAEDASWAVPAAVRAQRVAVRPIGGGFVTSALTVHLDPRTLRRRSAEE